MPMALQTAFQTRYSDKTPAACVPNAREPYSALALETAGLGALIADIPLPAE